MPIIKSTPNPDIRLPFNPAHCVLVFQTKLRPDFRKQPKVVLLFALEFLRNKIANNFVQRLSIFYAFLVRYKPWVFDQLGPPNYSQETLKHTLYRSRQRQILPIRSLINISRGRVDFLISQAVADGPRYPVLYRFGRYE